MFLKKISFALFLIILSSRANAGLVVNPTRLEFNEKDTQKIARISNTSNEEKTYRVFFDHLVFDKNGKVSKIKTPQNGEKFADDLIVFSPKKIVLQPNESQTIRLMFKKNSSLADGEYRSHITFAEEKKPEKNIKTNKSKSISVSIKPLFSVSIPAIINLGEKNGKVAIEKMSLDGNSLKLTLKRSGNSSLFADLFIKAIDDKKNEHEVGLINGISLLYPSSERDFALNLSLPKSLEGKQIKIEATLFLREEKDGAYETNKDKVLAQKTISLKNDKN